MATTKKISKKNKKERYPTSEPAVSLKKQLRLAFGLFFLLSGIFICFAIISYCFTWQADQDKLISTGSLTHFIFQENTPVANWGGRLGAALSHQLVYNGAGIASMVLGIWIAAIGLNLVYGKKVIPLMRYLRWFSIILLIGAPTLAYIMPHTSFSFGGAWGNEAIIYLNGLIGKIGTGLILASTGLFFLFVIFALDITPLLKRAKRRAKDLAASMIPEPAGIQNAEEDNHQIAHIEEENNSKHYDFILTDKAGKKKR